MQTDTPNADKTKKLLIISAVIIVVLALIAGYFMYQYVQNANKPSAVSQETTKRIVSKVGKLYALPKNEEPTVAQVKDKEKLKDQTYFKDAMDGDYLLIYTNAKLAILYRESTNQLINVGPISIAQQQPPATPQPVSKATVKVLNGTTKSGLAATTGATIASKLGEAVSVDPAYGDAKNKNVKQSIVVAINTNKVDVAKKIAEAIGGTVGALPAGEAAPSADILVIAGQ